MAREPKHPTFEQLYGKLEEQVGKLEQGGLTLEEAIAVYEEGMQLARACQDRLDEAELKITKLRESFTPVARNGASVRDEPQDDQYVSQDAPQDDDFA